jgi:hypothetical protein
MGNISEELDLLWNNYKNATWNTMSVPNATIWETKEND